MYWTTVTLYFLQSDQKWWAENFLFNTMVAPENRWLWIHSQHTRQLQQQGLHTIYKTKDTLCSTQTQALTYITNLSCPPSKTNQRVTSYSKHIPPPHPTSTPKTISPYSLSIPTIIILTFSPAFYLMFNITWILTFFSAMQQNLFQSLLHMNTAACSRNHKILCVSHMNSALLKTPQNSMPITHHDMNLTLPKAPQNQMSITQEFKCLLHMEPKLCPRQQAVQCLTHTQIGVKVLIFFKNADSQLTGCYLHPRAWWNSWPEEWQEYWQLVVVGFFSSHARIWGRRFDESFPTCTFFFCKQRSAHVHQLHSLGQD